MVDCYGRWTYEQNTPENKKCDLDRIGDFIIESNYKIKTDIENLAYMVIGMFDYENTVKDYGGFFSIKGCLNYVRDCGGFAEFDYYC